VDVTDGRVRVREFGALYDVQLIDISTGGFLASTPIPYPLNAIREFMFRWRNGGSGVLRAAAVYSHSRPVGGESQWLEYLTGFSFLDAQSPSIAEEIDAVMERALLPAG
jgi:hypothetical protein